MIFVLVYYNQPHRTESYRREGNWIKVLQYVVCCVFMYVCVLCVCVCGVGVYVCVYVGLRIKNENFGFFVY